MVQANHAVASENSPPGSSPALDSSRNGGGITIAFGRALLATKGYGAPLVGETYARAHLLAEQLDRSEYLFPLLYGQCTFHHVRREHQLALSIAQRLEHLGKSQNDVAMLLVAQIMQGIHSFHSGEFVSARAIFQRCYAMNDEPTRAITRAGCAAVTAEDPHVVILVHYALSLAYLGFVDQARCWVQKALTEARQLGHVYSLAWAAVWAAWIECAAGSPYELRKYAEQAVSLSDEHGFSYWLAWGLLYSGSSMASLGEPERGYTLIARGLSVHRAAGSVVSEAFALVLLAEASAKLGRLTEGLKHLADAGHILERANDRYHEAEMYRVRGDLLNATGDLTGAEDSYRTAIAVAQHQHAKVFELRAATGLGRLWRDQGKRTEAYDVLAPVYGWFTEGFETSVFKEAKALLNELGCVDKFDPVPGGRELDHPRKVSAS
jgi:tetratricopeptide (TPR) repeat protein